MNCLSSIEEHTQQMTLAAAHWNEARSGGACSWGHYTLAILETIPIIGTLAVLIERVIIYVASLLCSEKKEEQPTPEPMPLFTVLPPLPELPKEIIIESEVLASTTDRSEETLERARTEVLAKIKAKLKELRQPYFGPITFSPELFSNRFKSLLGMKI